MSSPKQLAGYVLQERLAVGGMAEIYRAQRLGPAAFSKQVAIKVVLPDLASDASFIRMFLQEAQLSAQLSAENLVQVFDFGQEDGSFFLVMEYIDGVSLSTLLQAMGPLPWPVVAYLGRQICTALAYLHQAQNEAGQPLDIVHRDITPGNILLSTRGAVKLGDFGIAKWQARSSRTERGKIKGTLTYLSPEQARGDEVDARTDLYGLGLVLFESLTGQRFLQATNEVDLLRVAQQPPFCRAATLRAGLPLELDALVVRALDPEPARRFAMAAHLEQALARCTSTEEDLAARDQLGALVSQCRAAVAQTAPRDATSSPSSVALSRDPKPASRPPEISRRTEVMAAGVPRSPAAPPWKKKGLLLATAVVAVIISGGLWLAWPEDAAPRVATSPRAQSTHLPGHHAGDARVRQSSDLHVSAGRDAGPPAVAHPPRSSLRINPVNPASTAQDKTSHRRALLGPWPQAQPTTKPTPDAMLIIPPAPPALAARGSDAGSSSPIQTATMLEDIKKRLTERGILPLDAPQIYQKLTTLFAAQKKDQLSVAAVLNLRNQVESLRVDRAFIETKLQRLNSLLAARTLPENVQSEVRQHTHRALSDVVNGRLIEANRELNKIAHWLH